MLYYLIVCRSLTYAQRTAAALERAGIETRTAYAPGWAKAYDRPVAAVGLRTGESRGGAMSHYLGRQTDPETLASREVYGLRLELTLSVDIYCPAREGAADRVLAGLRRLREQTALTVAVGNDLFADGMDYDADTLAYLRALAALSCETAALADGVFEVVCGIPLRYK